MLLDKQISELLTPNTLRAIFSVDKSIKKEEETISINRSSRKSTIEHAIRHGFKEGLGEF